MMALTNMHSDKEPSVLNLMKSSRWCSEKINVQKNKKSWEIILTEGENLLEYWISRRILRKRGEMRQNFRFEFKKKVPKL